jgi:hypothetical protein
VLALARRHPDGGVPAEPQALRRFYAFTSFPHFLHVYRQVNLLVRTDADVVTLVDGLAAQSAAARARYAEVQVTPVRNRMAGIDYDDLAQAFLGSPGSAFVRTPSFLRAMVVTSAMVLACVPIAPRKWRPLRTTRALTSGAPREQIRAAYPPDLAPQCARSSNLERLDLPSLIVLSLQW